MFVQMQAFGSVEREPELKVTKDGVPVTDFSLAVTTRRCVEDITMWLYCYAWGDQAENIKRSVTKGALLFVQGDFTSHPYTTEDGKQEVSLEVNVKSFSLAEGSTLPGIGKPLAEILPLHSVQGFGSCAQDDNCRSLL